MTKRLLMVVITVLSLAAFSVDVFAQDSTGTAPSSGTSSGTTTKSTAKHRKTRRHRRKATTAKHHAAKKDSTSTP